MELARALAVSESKSLKEVIHFYGAIEDDNEEYFRLYPKPREKSRYFRVKKDDVVDNLHEITNEELKAAGIAPRFGFTPATQFKMFEIPIRHGAKMEYITIQKAEAGVIYPMDAVNNSFNDKKESGCGCQSKKKDETGNGQELLSLCRTRVPCASGCCMHKFGECPCVDTCNANCTYP